MTKKLQKQTSNGLQSSFEVATISPKGIKGLLRAVKLNWVFLAELTIDKENPLKAQYRAQAILQGDARQTLTALKNALTQYLPNASTGWNEAAREDVMTRAFTLDGHGALIKVDKITGEYLINTHSTVLRADESEEFVAKFPPVLRTQNGEQVTDKEAIKKLFYSGVYADLAIYLAAYDVKRGRGVTVYLNGVQKLSDGEPLSGYIDPFGGVTPTKLPANFAKALL